MGVLLDVYSLVKNCRAIGSLRDGTTTCCGETCSISCCGGCGVSCVVIWSLSPPAWEGVGLKDKRKKKEERQSPERRET